MGEIDALNKNIAKEQTQTHSRNVSDSETQRSDQMHLSERDTIRAGGICNPATATAVDSFVYYKSYVPFPKRAGRSNTTKEGRSESEFAVAASPDDSDKAKEDPSSSGSKGTVSLAWYGLGNLALANILAKQQDAKDKPGDPTVLENALDAFNEIPELGFLFEERLRMRPIGYTPERAPFYMLSLTPGEVVTIRQKSFSKRAGTLTEEAELEEEQKLDYSSTLTTELSEELIKSITNSLNWGINASVGANILDVVQIGGGANVAGSNVEEVSGTNSARRTEEIVRKVESMQKQRHKTVVSVSQEATFEEEAIRVLRNDESTVIKLYFRRMMQVLHISHERYGVRLCWAPCIKDPGKDIRELSPETFNEDLIRKKWENALPDESIVGPQPQAQKTLVSTQLHNTTGVLPLVGPITVDNSFPVMIPNGQEFVRVDVKIDTTPKKKPKAVVLYLADGTHKTYFRDWQGISAESWLEGGSGGPDVITNHPLGMNLPPVDTQGGFPVHYRYFVGGDGLDQDTMTAYFYLETRPTEAIQNAWEQRREQWWTEQANKEIEDRRAQLANEAKGSPINVWVPSEIMRRVIQDRIGTPDELAKKLNVERPECDVVQILQRIFAWEEIQATFYAPWWKDANQTGSLLALQTNIFNASWAKVYIPIRQGYEEQAIAVLLAAGGISEDNETIGEVAVHIRRMRDQLLPLFKRTYRPSREDVNDLLRPNRIQLTPIDENDRWMNDYEVETGFEVLNRFAVTVPTDGVDIEACDASCTDASGDGTARQQLQEANIKLRQQIAGHIGDSPVTSNVDL